ncbi:Uncharacterized protein Rs2_09870 [Raphanus sativus]|nr:Uncharacterized protein Rs2_09870 [Raphanus sativus]
MTQGRIGSNRPGLSRPVQQSPGLLSPIQAFRSRPACPGYSPLSMHSGPGLHARVTLPGPGLHARVTLPGPVLPGLRPQLLPCPGSSLRSRPFRSSRVQSEYLLG